MGNGAGSQRPARPVTRMVVPCQSIPAPNCVRAAAVSSVSSAARALVRTLSPAARAAAIKARWV